MARFSYQLTHTADDGTAIWSRGGEFPLGYSSWLGLRTLDNVIDLIAGHPHKAKESPPDSPATPVQHALNAIALRVIALARDTNIDPYARLDGIVSIVNNAVIAQRQ